MSYRIGLADVETSHAIAATFSLYPESIPHDNILQDFFIFCAAWKILGESRITSVSILDNMKRFKKDPTDDYVVVEAMHKFLSSIDVLVGHNIKKFDLKKFNTRAIANGFSPIPPLMMVDTLTEARKHFAFTSNRLDYLSKFLGGKGKKSTSQGLWLRALQGDKAAIKEMAGYNVVDIEELEFVYLKIRPWMQNHPNVSREPHEYLSCTLCDSGRLIKEGWKKSRNGRMITQQLWCKDCGGWSSGEKKKATTKKTVVK